MVKLQVLTRRSVICIRSKEENFVDFQEAKYKESTNKNHVSKEALELDLDGDELAYNEYIKTCIKLRLRVSLMALIPISCVCVGRGGELLPASFGSVSPTIQGCLCCDAGIIGGKKEVMEANSELANGESHAMCRCRYFLDTLGSEGEEWTKAAGGCIIGWNEDWETISSPTMHPLEDVRLGPPDFYPPTPNCPEETLTREAVQNGYKEATDGIEVVIKVVFEHWLNWEYLC
eukprot:Gb_27747 [translate_table: standard]